MGDAPGRESVQQCLRDGFLADDFRKSLRAKTAGKDGVVRIVGIHEKRVRGWWAARAGRPIPARAGGQKAISACT